MCVSSSDSSPRMHRAFLLTLETHTRRRKPTQDGRQQPGLAQAHAVFPAGVPSTRPDFFGSALPPHATLRMRAVHERCHGHPRNGDLGSCCGGAWHQFGSGLGSGSSGTFPRLPVGFYSMCV